MCIYINIYIYLYIIYRAIEGTFHTDPRLCIFVVMQEMPNAMNVLAPDCGSWGIPARGTSRRSYHNYQGATGFPFVAKGNLMVARLFDCSSC